jgi:hypothetical protein
MMSVINLYIYINKNNGYIYDLSNYVSLYYPSETPSIRKIGNVEKDSVEIILSKGTENSDWEIVSKDKNHIISSKYPVIYVPFDNINNIFEYKVINKNSGFKFTIKIQRLETGSILVLNTSIPYTQVDRYSFDYFCDVSWIDQVEKNAILRILHDEIKIDTCTNTMSKIEVISRHINNVTRNNGDIGLNFWWNDYTGYQLYEKCIKGETNLTCNEYLQIYYLFANLAGIKTRRIGLIGHGESDGLVKLSGHHFNESYVDELNRWIFVDLSFNKAFVLNSKGIPLNTFELYMANVSGTTSNLLTAVLSGDSIVHRQYEQVNNPEVDYFNGNCLIQYKSGNDRFSIINQLLRYTLTPEPVLGLNYSNERLLFKKLMLFFLFISIIMFVTSIIAFTRLK